MKRRKNEGAQQPAANPRTELLQLMLSQYDPASERDPDCLMLTSADIVAQAADTLHFSVEDVTTYLRAAGFTLQLQGTRWVWLMKRHRICP